ncbi:hypothetical protein QYE76_021026 [Lolium multiflorum]|uniref:5'-deoxynucleotidase n=1 Tax=Lolium multiflorum TaxID=4521 RepID=A0AAD8R9U4_LOLMU|nr:hypothetical protein QYE76_021026 [Lolium multiflorum]
MSAQSGPPGASTRRADFAALRHHHLHLHAAIPGRPPHRLALYLTPAMGGSRALSLSSLCAAAAASRSPLLSSHHRARHLRPRLAAAMSSSSSPSPAPAPGAAPAAPSASSAIDFLTLCYRLKTTKRAGWVRRGLQGPESVADHMYRMGVMALVAADLPPGVNRDRCVKMAIVHDIAEAIVGDITPADGVPKEEKSRREKEALDQMCALLGGGSRADEIRELWMEYEDNATLEAKVVKDFDKVEMILQALEYEKEQGRDLEEFFQSTAGKFQTDVGKAWAAEIASRRNRRTKLCLMFCQPMMTLIPKNYDANENLGPAIVGDITPADGVPKEEKSRREKEALDQMCALLGGGSRADEIRELWMEYEDNATLEAKVVKMILTRARTGPRRVLPINGREISNRCWKSMGSEIASRRK